MGANLIEQLRLVEDFRTSDGRRHPLLKELELVQAKHIMRLSVTSTP
ncbi:MAG: hypothetical protein HEQ35_14805 [Gloeotrichia echinulata IR180]|jgi:hypothetical protein|nr:hypothetical protein [Gloeotrichia echinulata DEX184]